MNFLQERSNEHDGETERFYISECFSNHLDKCEQHVLKIKDSPSNKIYNLLTLNIFDPWKNLKNFQAPWCQKLSIAHCTHKTKINDAFAVTKETIFRYDEVSDVCKKIREISMTQYWEFLRNVSILPQENNVETTSGSNKKRNYCFVFICDAIRSALNDAIYIAATLDIQDSMHLFNVPVNALTGAPLRPSSQHSQFQDTLNSISKVLFSALSSYSTGFPTAPIVTLHPSLPIRENIERIVDSLRTIYNLSLACHVNILAALTNPSPPQNEHLIKMRSIKPIDELKIQVNEYAYVIRIISILLFHYTNEAGSQQQ